MLHCVTLRDRLTGSSPGAIFVPRMFTGLVIALLAIVGGAVVVGGGMIALSKRADRALPGSDDELRLLGDGRTPDLVERGFKDLRVGDVVQYETRDWLVEGVIEYDEDGHRWRGGRLVDGKDEAWLVVGLERGGSARLRLMREDPDVHITGYPPDKLVTHGTTFTQETRGTATAKVTGEAGDFPGADDNAPDSVLRCRWWRYETPGRKALVVEQWGGLYRVLSGDLLKTSDLELMPGS